KKLIDLISGKPIAINQLLSKCFRVGETCLEIRQFLQLPRFQQPKLAKRIYQGRTKNGHASDLHRECFANSLAILSRLCRNSQNKVRSRSQLATPGSPLRLAHLTARPYDVIRLKSRLSTPRGCY